MSTKEKNKLIRSTYFERFKEEGKNHIPPINPSWVNKFINRYLASESVIPIEEKWQEYLNNKKGKTDWEFFICANAKKYDEFVSIKSIYHEPLINHSKKVNFLNFIQDYCKQNDLQFKKINNKEYKLGFYRKVFKNKNNK